MLAILLTRRSCAGFRPAVVVASIKSSSSALWFSTASTGETQAVPMTLLSGFLGTGKTSTLKHLLENEQDLKIGVVVNDVASVNIDAKLVTCQTQDMVELQNGCACCSLADELFESVQQLVTNRELDAIVVELSGVADPMAIKANWKMAPPAVKQQADISKVVTLVDAGTFGSDYMTWDLAGERDKWTVDDVSSANRKVSELLAEQVEAADLILVNKIDLASPEEVQVASSVARALNDKATLVQVEFGRVSPSDLISTAAKEDEGHSRHHDHSHSHSHDHHAETAACTDPDCTGDNTSHSHSHGDHSTAELGIDSFVYKAATPFNPRKLMNVLNQWPVPKKTLLDKELLTSADHARTRAYYKESPFVGVIRSKGFCWFAPSQWAGSAGDPWRHDTAMYWSHAGKHFSVNAAGKWWGTLSRDQMKAYFQTNLAEYERILAEDFVSDEFGDRRQEIVFIGTNLQEDKIRETLDDCLLTKAELEKYRQQLANFMMQQSASGGGR